MSVIPYLNRSLWSRKANWKNHLGSNTSVFHCAYSAGNYQYRRYCSNERRRMRIYEGKLIIFTSFFTFTYNIQVKFIITKILQLIPLICFSRPLHSSVIHGENKTRRDLLELSWIYNKIKHGLLLWSFSANRFFIRVMEF